MTQPYRNSRLTRKARALLHPPLLSISMVCKLHLMITLQGTYSMSSIMMVATVGLTLKGHTAVRGETCAAPRQTFQGQAGTMTF